MIGGAIFLSLFGALVLESSISTRSGLFERFHEPENPERFEVWRKPVRGPRVKIEDFNPASEEGVQSVRSLPDSRLWIFDKSALTVLPYPTPLSEPELFIVSLKDRVRVYGREEINYLLCPDSGVCLWRQSYLEEPEAAVQKSVLTFLWRAEGELLLSGIQKDLPDLTAHSWAWESNRSLYASPERTLYFGRGAYPDGLDGFVVVHEWAHFLLNEINPEMRGREARILHEAFADFYASNLFGSACFAPYDAQEISGRECVRNLLETRRWPDDLSSDIHDSSLILSGALWALRSFIPRPLLNEMIVEAAIRMPKRAKVQEFWAKIFEIYARFIRERPLLSDRRDLFQKIAAERGLSN